MSFSLPDVDLTTAVVGTSGKILLQNMGISAGGISANPATYKNPAMLNIRNDSGCGLGMVLRDTGGQFTLGAGEWTQQPIPPGESAIVYTVKYLLPNPPVSLLMIDYYAPGETVPQTSTLGNSPVGIGGSVQTSSVQTLSNEGNAAGGLVEDIGDVAFAQLFTIFTDGHGVWAVDQSGVKHQVLKIQTVGNPLQVGQAGDITEILGKLTVDGTSILKGILTLNAALSLNPTAVSVAGGTSGTANLYQLLVGTVKIVVVSLSSFQTGVSNQNLALPTPFTTSALFWCGDTSNFSLLLSGVAQSINVVTALAVAGGSTAPATVVHINSQGNIIGGFDTVQFTSGGATPHTGILLLAGV